MNSPGYGGSVAMVEEIRPFENESYLAIGLLYIY